jgi:hypothetical protein
MTRFSICSILTLILTSNCISHAASSQEILPMKERAALIDRLLADRLQTLPAILMRREGIAMWILVAREYNEDPVVRTMLPGKSHSARRRTILVFVDEGESGVKGYAVSRYGVGNFFKPVWNPEEEPDQWQALADLITEKNPRNIGINVSKDFAHADGLTHGEHQGLVGALSENQVKKIVSAESLAVSWLERRTQAELEIYPDIVTIAHEIIREGFSNQVITPGTTSTEDVMWWYRDRIRELRLNTWFHPTVDIQRADGTEKEFIDSFTGTEKDGIILPGDLLHVDFGITYLRLNTDTQQHAYVLKPGEKSPPAGLVAALRQGNKLQDILISQFKSGRSGNEILKLARDKAIGQGLRPTIYTHPLGYHGHGAGPTIGMWDNQQDTVGRGDFPMHEHTVYSIEFNVTVSIAEWDNKDIRIMLEEDAYFDGSKTTFLVPRQTSFHLIRPH